MRHAHRLALKQRIRQEVHRRYPRHDLAKALTWGTALVAIGAWWLWRGADAWLWDRENWTTLVPALIAWSGLVLAGVVRTVWALVTGLQRVAIGAWLYAGLHSLWGLTLWQTWPVALVIAGVSIVARGLMEPLQAWDDAPGDDAPPMPPAPAAPPMPTTHREESPQ